MAPLLHMYVNGKFPVTSISIAPEDSPEQSTSVTPVIDGTTSISLTAAVILAVHPFISVTVTVYVPENITDKSSVVAPLLHKYVSEGNPPLTVRSTAPSLFPHVALVSETVKDGAPVMVTTTCAVPVHPDSSVTVTV